LQVDNTRGVLAGAITAKQEGDEAVGGRFPQFTETKTHLGHLNQGVPREGWGLRGWAGG